MEVIIKGFRGMVVREGERERERQNNTVKFSGPFYKTEFQCM